MTARPDLYDFATVNFREYGVPPVVHEYATRLLDAYRAEVLREAADMAEQLNGCPCNSALTVAHHLRVAAVSGPRGNTTTEPDAGAPAQFRNCHTDDGYRSALTRSPEQSCGRQKPHPAHKHLIARASWQCPGVPAPQGPAGEAAPQ